jgi:hypothetical protein
MRMLFKLISLVLMMFAVGCAASIEFDPRLARRTPGSNHSSNWMMESSDRPISASMQAPATGPAGTTTTQPIEGEIQLANAVPMESLIQGAGRIDFIRALRPVQDETIYFGYLRTTQGAQRTQVMPLIARRERQAWKALQIDVREPGAGEMRWSYVGAGPQRGHAWAALDPQESRNGGSTSRLILLNSTDSGATWQVNSILKPSASARFESIAMGPQHGRVTLYQPGGEPGARRGYYHYQTHDGGASWTAPTYEPDNLTPADPVGEQEQPRLRRDGKAASAN